jgi:hypothetical protein
MAGLGPAIHDFKKENMDTRAKRGHDDSVNL